MAATAVKRQNFNVTPDEEAELDSLRSALRAASVKDALLRATRIVLSLTSEVRDGGRVYVEGPDGATARVLMPDVETPAARQWTYLVSRPNSWKRQLYVKGSRVTASAVWMDMQANGMGPTEAADNWDLPVSAIDEIVRYCAANSSLIAMEAAEEERYLHAAGVLRESAPT